MKHHSCTRPTLSLGLLLVLASVVMSDPHPSIAQERKNISWTATAQNTKITVQQALEIPDIAGHILRINEFRRSWPEGGGPIIEGQKAVEEIARGVTDIIAGNGRGSGYSVWRFENGDMTFGEWQNTIQTVVNPDGGRKTTFMGTYVTSGGTGRFKGIRGFGRYAGVAELDAEGKTKANQYSAEGEYWIAEK